MGTAQPLFQGLYVEGSVDPKKILRILGPRAAQVNIVEPFIASHEQVYAYLDNDDAGRKATAGLKPVCRYLSDQSVHYRPHNDLNDYLRSRWPVKEHKRSRGRKL